jgi:hypothetical protein
VSRGRQLGAKQHLEQDGRSGASGAGGPGAVPGRVTQRDQPPVFPDSRVTSLWDQDAVSGQWFSRHVTGEPGPTWDYYLLFAPRARWGAVPGPIVSQGGMVIGQSGQLLAAIRPLLR